MRSRVLFVAVSLLVIAGCSSSDGGSSSATTATSVVSTTAAPSTPASTTAPVTSTDPANAPKLPDEYVAEAIPAGTLGKADDLGHGLTVTISHPAIARDHDHPWIEVAVVAQNAASAAATTAPGVQLVCSGLSDGGGNLDTQSYPAGKPLAPGATAKGKAQLVLPGDGGFGDPQLCLFPAYVRLDVKGPAGKVVQRRFDLPKSLIDELDHQVAVRQCEISPSGCNPPTS